MRNVRSGAPDSSHFHGHVKSVRVRHEKTANEKGEDIRLNKGPMVLYECRAIDAMTDQAKIWFMRVRRCTYCRGIGDRGAVALYLLGSEGEAGEDLMCMSKETLVEEGELRK